MRSIVVSIFAWRELGTTTVAPDSILASATQKPIQDVPPRTRTRLLRSFEVYLEVVGTVIVMVVVGGMGSVTGAVVGAIILTLMPELLRGLEGGASIGPLKLPLLFGLSNIVMAVAFVLVMIFRRTGLFGDRELPLLWVARGRAKAAPLDVSPLVTKET